MTEHFKDLARFETESHIENEELKATLEKVQEQLQSQVAEREAEKEEHRRQMEELQKAREADKEELRKEFMSMLTAQMQGASPQVIVLQDLNLHIYLVSMFIIGIVFFCCTSICALLWEP
jgi:Skp family chaperone for outer membrane proteins